MSRVARRSGGLALALTVCFLAVPARALTFEAGLVGALRTVQSSRIRDVYGNGIVAAPYIAARVAGRLCLALGCELGYDRSGTIGLYDEATDLSIGGWDAFLRWDATTGRRLTPYLKAGLGRFRYEQTIESAVPLTNRARGSKTAPLAGAGVRIGLGGRLSGLVEVLYVPLKVRPFDVEVDLGGWRLGLGLACALAP
jgi:opacity protein-like surface antigen